MADWKQLVSLNPDDRDEIFCKKLSVIPIHNLPAEISKFETYTKYLPLLKFHRATLRRPEMNVKLVYNDKYGWHISSCLKSISDTSEEKCTCEKDVLNPKKFLLEIETDFRLKQNWVKKFIRNGKRCKICKHYKVDFEMISSDPSGL